MEVEVKVENKKKLDLQRRRSQKQMGDLQDLQSRPEEETWQLQQQDIEQKAK